MPKKPKSTMSGMAEFLDVLNEANGKVEEGIYSYKHASEVPENIQKYGNICPAELFHANGE